MCHQKTSAVIVALCLSVTIVMVTSVSPTYASVGDCSQPVTDGDFPTAVDCLYILKATTGAISCTPECICDPTGDGSITVADALKCFYRAVQMPVSLLCCGATTTTVTTSTTVPRICASPGAACGAEMPCCIGNCPASGVCCKIWGSCTQDSDCCNGYCQESNGICRRFDWR